MRKGTALFLAVPALLAIGCLGQTEDDIAEYYDLAGRADLAATGYDLSRGDLSVTPGGDMTSGDADGGEHSDLGRDLGVTRDLAGAGDLSMVPVTCLPSGGCPQGPPCGNGCCGAGEACDPVSHTCRCGGGAACGAKMICASGVFRADGCGSICCGGGVPCPP